MQGHTEKELDTPALIFFIEWEVLRLLSGEASCDHATMAQNIKKIAKIAIESFTFPRARE